MTRTIGGFCKKMFSCWGKLQTPHSHHNANVTEDIREEYAKAFRTQSYFDFWNRVTEITYHDHLTPISTESPSSSGARLPSYRLFIEHLLDPDQDSITELLNKTRFFNDTKLFLIDYFLETANASLLCGHLLKDIDQIRSNKPNNSIVPFSSTRFHDVQSRCVDLLKRLEISRDKVCAKLRLLKRLQQGCAITLVFVTVSFTVIVVTHGLFAFIAFPGFVVASVRVRSVKEMGRAYAQLDAAAKGAYILTRDLDTISRMVARVKDDLEHNRGKIGMIAMMRVADRVRVNDEVMRQLKMNDVSLREQLDELEEHLYLCFITINRARNLVVKEIMDLKPR